MGYIICQHTDTNKTVMNKQKLCVLTMGHAAPVACEYTAEMWHWTSAPKPELRSLPIQPELLLWLHRSRSYVRQMVGWQPKLVRVLGTSHMNTDFVSIFP